MTIKELIENMDNVLNSISKLKNKYGDRKDELFKNSKSDKVLDILEEIVKLKHWEQSVLALKQEMLEIPPIAVDDNKDVKLQCVTLFNIKYTFTSFKELLIVVAEVLVSKKPYDIINFPQNVNLNDGKNKKFSYTKEDIKSKPHKLTNGMYIETDYDNQSIVTLCNTMLAICNYSQEEI